MSEQETKAIVAVAETTGKAMDMVRELGRFIARFIGGSLEQAVGIGEDKLKYMRWERQMRLIQRCDAFLAANGMTEPTRYVPMSIAIPLLQGASIEENDHLQDRWAKLLVNAGDKESDVNVPRLFVSIMENMDPLGAEVFDKIYSVPDEEVEDGIWTRDLPDRVVLKRNSDEDMSLSIELEVALSNLAIHRLVNPTVFMSGVIGLTCVHKTQLGKEFFKACTLRSE